MRYVEVSDDESWDDVATRLTGCSEVEQRAEIVVHLQDVNPISAVVGLDADQTLAFDPALVSARACDQEARRGDRAAADGGSDFEPADLASGEVDDVPVAPVDDGEAETAADVEPSLAPEIGFDDDFTVAFAEPFETDSSIERFDFAIHHPVLFGEPIRTWEGDHDTTCAAPPTLRTVDLPGDRQAGDGKIYDDEIGDVVYWCAPGGPETGHMMTSFLTLGYAQIDFSPKEVFEDVRRVCWDQNMTDLGSRKWTQMVIVGVDEFEANDGRMDYVTPHLDDGPASLATKLSDQTFLLEVHGGSTIVHSSGRPDANFLGFSNEDKKRRFTTCVTDLGNGTVEIQLERESEVEVRTHPGAFPAGEVKVIFQDETYNAPKSPPVLDVDSPFTWHWDNISIEVG